MRRKKAPVRQSPKNQKKIRKEVKTKKSQTERVEQLIAHLEDPHASREEYTHQVKDLKKEVQKMPPEELAEWIMERHDMFVSRIDYQFSYDFLNGTRFMERHLILTYMMEIVNLFTFLDIETLPNETISYLYKKNYAELLAILNVLNYI